MKIYFACAIRGGNKNEIPYSDIVAELRGIGHDVFAPFETGWSLSDRHIYLRDINEINKCDLVVAEVSNPSLGVGYEIGYTEGIKKPIICMAYQSSSINVSAMVTGGDVLFHRYNDESEE